jgi:hypothetical protein
MPIENLHCYLVHPSKNEEEQPEIRGAGVPLRGKLFQMLSRMYEEAETECDIESVFRPSLDGSQAIFYSTIFVTRPWRLVQPSPVAFNE